MNKPLLAELRAATAYCTLRRFATFFEGLGYLLSFSMLVHAVMMASHNNAADSQNAMVSLVTAVVVAILTRYVKLSAFMFMDIADAQLDMARMMREQFGKGSAHSE
jgi:hypothetical protein